MISGLKVSFNNLTKPWRFGRQSRNSLVTALLNGRRLVNNENSSSAIHFFQATAYTSPSFNTPRRMSRNQLEEDESLLIEKVASLAVTEDIAVKSVGDIHASGDESFDKKIVENKNVDSSQSDKAAADGSCERFETKENSPVEGFRKERNDGDVAGTQTKSRGGAKNIGGKISSKKSSLLLNLPENDLRHQRLQELAEKLSSGKFKRVMILSGAGVSCSAGIPDFRTPGTGLYDNLQRYNLPQAEAVFDVDFYRHNPRPFVSLARELWPGQSVHLPTLTHCFVRLLEEKGLLLRNYTQNIDGLEVLAGVSEDRVFECHGHFRTASCIDCGRSYDGNLCQEKILNENVAPTCKRCGGLVKPDIVFFGENLPPAFFPLLEKDIDALDRDGLLIVMGTSLEVMPVAAIPNMVERGCSRLLLNRELVGDFADRFVEKSPKLFVPCDCDSGVRYLCRFAGWESELDSIYNEVQK